jgi:uncharacterized protein
MARRPATPEVTREVSDTAWVGWLQAGGPALFVRIESGAGGAWQVSVPGLGWFGVPAVLRQAGPAIEAEFTTGGRRFRIAGGVTGQHAAGVAHCDGAAGDFELWTATPLDEPAYRRFIARFRGQGRSLSLQVQSDTFFGEPVALYRDGDDLVRLHPVSASQLVSEQAELIELIGLGGAPGPAGLTIRTGRGSAARLDPARSWEEQDVTFAGPGGQLAGTLMTPRTRGPHGAVALVHGSGTSTRDFYRIFGEVFTDAGVAALIYDKRGHGRSAGTAAGSTIATRSGDAEAALSFLQARPGIAADKVGLYGFSNGAWSVPMVSGRRGDVAFVTVMGAPGVSPAQSEVHRKTFELREHGVPEDACSLVAVMWEIIYQFRQTRILPERDVTVFDEAAEQLAGSAALAGFRPQQYAIDNPDLSPVPPYRSHTELLAEPIEPDDGAMGYDPVPDYRRTRCPVLFTVGARDENVPAAASAERVTAALRDRVVPGSLVRIFPGAGHLMNVSDPDGLHGITTEEASYRFHRFRFAPGFLDLLRDWTAARLSAPAAPLPAPDLRGGAPLPP